MGPKTHHSYWLIRMSIIKNFIQKSVSVLRMGNLWVNKLISKLKIATFGNTYVETVSPSQSDTFHRYIKDSDENWFKRNFEICVRQILKCMNLSKVKVAFDVTEDPYWGKNGFGNTRSKFKEKSEESWQFLTLAIVEPQFIPLMSLPYKQTDNLDDLVIELLEYLKSLQLKIELVLFDRGFYHWHLIDYLNSKKTGKSWPYLIFIPKNKKIRKYIQETKGSIGIFEHEGKYSKSSSNWKPKTNIIILKGVWNEKLKKKINWCFATNQKPSLNLIKDYKKRWNIETGFRVHDEAKIKTKSSNPLIRFFYHLLSMLYVLIWRLKQKKLHFQIVFKRFLLNNFLDQQIMGDPP